MTENSQPSPHSKSLYLKEPVIATAIILFVVWSLLIGLSLYLNQLNLREQVTSMATAEARANWNKDQAFRGWATRHGGVYVRPDERTPPSPYLAHLKNRDLTTTDGTRLTLMNPAYMMQQMTREYETVYGIKGSITGKILLNPANAADEWEMKALTMFDQGIQEVLEETSINGSPYIRFMKPMIMVEGCVACHGHLGFKVGDIRGGVSVSIPLMPYINAAARTSDSIAISHISVWLLGCLGISGFGWSAHRRDGERQRLQQALMDNQGILEKRVDERTRELKAKEKELLDGQARAHYANKMASLGEMASGMAHEINSPLQAISLTTFRLQRNIATMEKTDISACMNKIENAVGNISKIIESLKNMSRDSINDPFMNIKLRDIIGDVTGITVERFNTNNITFKISYHGDSKASSFSCQRLQVAQIIINLLNNAFDAVMGSNEKWIHLDLYDNGQTITITVTDSGNGVPVSIQDRIFEPLYTSKDIGQGTGLGLSISSDISKRHGGSLHLDTESPHTRFVLCLPKTQPAEERQDQTGTNHL